MWLPIGILNAQKKSDSILEKKWPRNKSNAEDDPYETTNICIQQGNGLVGGGQYNYQQGGGGGFHSMHKCRNDGVERQRWKHDAKDNNPKKCPDKWRRGRHEIVNTKDINKLKWCEQHMPKVGSILYVHHKERWYRW